MKRALGLFVFLSMLVGLCPAWGAPPPFPQTPAPVLDLLYAREFRVDSGYAHAWSADRPQVTEGWILVLDVDPDLVYPRQVAEPVLYVGATPAERVSRGYPMGRLIVLVPSTVDLTTTPIWFGSPELPERIDTATGQRELERAGAARIEPFTSRVVERALADGGVPLVVRDRGQLIERLSELYLDRIAPLMPEDSPYAPRR